MIGRLKNKIWSTAVNFLTAVPADHRLSPNDFETIAERIRPGDVVLVEGQTRIGSIIKTLTRSPWSHSALCVGRLDEIEDLAIRELVHEHYDGPTDVPLLIEAEMGRGTVVVSLNFYSDFHVRIASPIGLSKVDARRMTNFIASRLGTSYDVVQILDLARFLIPWWFFVPRCWHSSLFEHNAGQATRNVCSSLIAETFMSVGFPLLPLVEKAEDGQLHYYRRNPRLFTPRDFDYSPFFRVLKFPLLAETPDGHYKKLNWREPSAEDSRRRNYMNAEDIVYVSAISDDCDDDNAAADTSEDKA